MPPESDVGQWGPITRDYWPWVSLVLLLWILPLLLRGQQLLLLLHHQHLHLLHDVFPQGVEVLPDPLHISFLRRHAVFPCLHPEEGALLACCAPHSSEHIRKQSEGV